MPSNQVSVHRSGIPGSCGDGLKGVPLSQGLFSVAEDSKQDICTDKCRKPVQRALCALPGFPALRRHPLTPWMALRARNTILFRKEAIPANNETRQARIEIRVTEKQKQQIVGLARKCGLSQSEYLRQRALGFEPKGTLPDAFFVCCERLDRLCRPPFSQETNEQALALLNEMQSILTNGYYGPLEPEPQEMIETSEEPAEEPKPRKRFFGLRR